MTSKMLGCYIHRDSMTTFALLTVDNLLENYNRILLLEILGQMETADILRRGGQNG